MVLFVSFYLESVQTPSSYLIDHGVELVPLKRLPVGHHSLKQVEVQYIETLFEYLTDHSSDDVVIFHPTARSSLTPTQIYVMRPTDDYDIWYFHRAQDNCTSEDTKGTPKFSGGYIINKDFIQAILGHRILRDGKTLLLPFRAGYIKTYNKGKKENLISVKYADTNLTTVDGILRNNICRNVVNKESDRTWIWIVVAGCAIFVLVVAYVIWQVIKSKKSEKL